MSRSDSIGPYCESETLSYSGWTNAHGAMLAISTSLKLSAVARVTGPGSKQEFQSSRHLSFKDRVLGGKEEWL